MIQAAIESCWPLFSGQNRQFRSEIGQAEREEQASIFVVSNLILISFFYLNIQSSIEVFLIFLHQCYHFLAKVDTLLPFLFSSIFTSISCLIFYYSLLNHRAFVNLLLFEAGFQSKIQSILGFHINLFFKEKIHKDWNIIDTVFVL